MEAQRVDPLAGVDEDAVGDGRVVTAFATVSTPEG